MLHSAQLWNPSAGFIGTSPIGSRTTTRFKALRSPALQMPLATYFSLYEIGIFYGIKGAIGAKVSFSASSASLRLCVFQMTPAAPSKRITNKRHRSVFHPTYPSVRRSKRGDDTCAEIHLIEPPLLHG